MRTRFFPVLTSFQNEELGYYRRLGACTSICLFLCLSGKLSGFVWRPEGEANKVKPLRPLALTWLQLQVTLMLKVCHESQHF